MGKLIYSMMVSLDGFVEGPNRELDWVRIDEEQHQFANDQEREVDIILYGRRLYELMAAYWPTADTNPSAAPVEVEYARIWRDKPKIVFSKTLERVDWNSRLVRENAAEEVAKLKAQPGRIMSVGGPDLASTFIRLGLVDEYHLLVQPVVLGRGTPFFPSLDQPIDLALVETRKFASGVVYLRYQRADGSR